MDDFSSISLLSLAMLVGCYVAGTIPLAVNFSEEKLKLITVLGAGLLCGTALAVIIPEGVHALYEEILEGAHHSHGQAGAVDASEAKVEAEAALSVSGKHEHGHEQLHACIGVSLVLGFVFMLLVDQIGSSHVHNTEDPESARAASSKITTTLGLVVHAAADGVALGAAASTSQTSVQLIVFVAIMLHKVRADRKTLVTLQTVLFFRGFEPVTSAGSRRLRPGFLPDARRPGEEPNPQTPAGFRAGRARPRHADVFGPQPEQQRGSVQHQRHRRRHAVLRWNLPLCGHGPRPAGGGGPRPQPRPCRRERREGTEQSGGGGSGAGLPDPPGVVRRPPPLDRPLTSWRWRSRRSPFRTLKEAAADPVRFSSSDGEMVTDDQQDSVKCASSLLSVVRK
uniref:Zinc transporter ZIP9 n=1 Tax=Oryzias latipes TaxID=8090 RepID=A0A3P9IN52_ORYLA